jgi:hypothetical protein
MKKVKLSICAVIFCNLIHINVTWYTLFFYENNVKIFVLMLGFMTIKITHPVIDGSAYLLSNIGLVVDAKVLM